MMTNARRNESDNHDLINNEDSQHRQRLFNGQKSTHTKSRNNIVMDKHKNKNNTLYGTTQKLSFIRQNTKTKHPGQNIPKTPHMLSLVTTCKTLLLAIVQLIIIVFFYKKKFNFQNTINFQNTLNCAETLNAVQLFHSTKLFSSSIKFIY